MRLINSNILLKISKQILSDIATDKQVLDLQKKLDSNALDTFRQLQEIADNKIASGDNKAKKMLQQAIGLSKKNSLHGNSLRKYLLCVVAFISLTCGIAKADVVNLDDSNVLRNVMKNHVEKTVSVNKTIKNYSMLSEFLRVFNPYLGKVKAKKFNQAIQQIIDEKGDISNMTIQQVFQQAAKKANMLNDFEDALFESQFQDLDAYYQSCK